MQRGTIKSFEMNRGIGWISGTESGDLEFYANNIIARDRSSLKQGDIVFYEVENVRNHHTAINIRKCSP